MDIDCIGGAVSLGGALGCRCPLIQSSGRGSLENTDQLSNGEKTTEGVMRMRLLDTASAILPPLYSVALSSEHDRSGEP